MIRSHEELEVYRVAFKAAMRIFEGKLVNMIINPAPWILKKVKG